MVQVVEHLSVAELEARYEACEDVTSSRHFQTIFLLGKGHSTREVAEIAEIVAEEAEAHPGVPVEAFATDEHRLGLKPVVRRVWAPIGVRPIAPGHHRFEWLYVTAFVSPATGECFWYISNGVSKPFFEALLAAFAEEAGAGRDRIIPLVLDNAGWHGESNLKVPDGIRLVFLPPYTPELQPAEHLWEVVDEPILNKHIPDLQTLEAIVADCCTRLADPQTLKGRAGFSWWPKITNPN